MVCEAGGFFKPIIVSLLFGGKFLTHEVLKYKHKLKFSN